MEFKSEKSIGQTLITIGKTVAGAFLITVVLMAVLALLICFTPLPEDAVTPSVYVLNYFSVFMAGLISAAKSRSRGFVAGGLAGAVYMTLIYALGFALFGGIEFSRTVINMIFCCTAVGMVGGIVGINLIRK